TYLDRNTNEEHHIELEGVFVQIGLVPNTEWLGDVVEKTKSGEIVVDRRGATSIPGVFAAGDCTDSAFKQIIISMGDGATARSEEHTSELQSRFDLVCRLLLE